jgi:TPR repeat protein
VAQCVFGQIAENSGELDEAARWYARARDQGYVRAIPLLNDLTGSQESVRPDRQVNLDAARAFIGASREATIAARRSGALVDDAISEVQLALLLLGGSNSEKDDAIVWLTAAALQENAEASYQLALLFEKGEGVEADFEKAIILFKIAAEQGYEKAQRQMGIYYEYGFGVQQDFNKAVTWYKKARDQEVTRTGFSAIYVESIEYRIARRYQLGFGAVQNNALAFDWYKRAAEHGSQTAQVRLAQCFEGKGPLNGFAPIDYRLAVHWYTQAANGGYLGALKPLRDMYREGRGVAQDNQMALHWHTLLEDSNPFPDHFP